MDSIGNTSESEAIGLQRNLMDKIPGADELMA